MAKISGAEHPEVVPLIFGALGALALGLVAWLGGHGVVVTALAAIGGSVMYLLTRDWTSRGKAALRNDGSAAKFKRHKCD